MLCCGQKLERVFVVSTTMVVRRVKRVCQCVIVLMFHSPCCSYLDVARLELLSFRHRFLVCLQLDSELLRNMLNGTIGNGNKSYANKPPTNGNGKWLCKCVAALTLLLFITFWCVIIFYASRRHQVLDVAVSHDYPLPDVPTRYSDNSRIPLLFHQMWKSERIPAKWRSAHEGCMALNSEYELILWTDEMIYNFIYRYYPWFYRIFLSYPYQIQRVDVARYFILYHYGGVYLDVDAACVTPFRDIIANMSDTESVLLPMTDIYGVTNSFMVSEPKSTFFQYVMYELPNYAHGGYKIIRHTTIIFSTGPMFMSHCVTTFDDQASIHVMTLSDYDEKHFRHAKGGSWHGMDTEVVDAFHFHYVELLIILSIVLITCLICRFKHDSLSACAGYLLTCVPCLRKKDVAKFREYSPTGSRILRDNKQSHSRTSSRDLNHPEIPVIKDQALMA